ncbi:MAG: Uma2 family endonuclease [Planctomycetaceae bacterium]
MATAPDSNRFMTVEEYLAFERASETKHEFYRGEVFAMGGASTTHNRIVRNVNRRFDEQFDDRECEVLASDQRVKVLSTGLYTYPDLVVVCGKMEFEDDTFDTLLNPQVVIEVLSDSTEAYDRGKKFALFRELDSLRSYVLISQKEPRVEVFTRHESGDWMMRDAVGMDATIELSAIDVSLRLQDVFKRVEFPPPDDDTPERK